MTTVRTIEAVDRPQVGRGPARAARRAGLVPAVVYGGTRQPRSVSVTLKDLSQHLHAGGFTNSLFALRLDDKTQKVLPREVQFDPITDWPVHVDFMRVEEDTRVTIQVPVTWAGEEECPGLRRGGVLNIVRHEIEMLCPAGAIPESIEISVAGLDIGDGVHISAVTLPEGAQSTITDRDFTIVTIAAPSGMVTEEEEAEAAEAEALEALELEAGAPEPEDGADGEGEG